MPTPPFDPYRPPVAPVEPASPSGPGAHAVSLLLVDVALVPLAINIIAFVLPLILMRPAQPLERGGAGLPWVHLLLIGGALAAALGVVRLRRLPEGQHVSLALRVVVGILVVATLISVPLRLLDGPPMVRAVAYVARVVRDSFTRPAFMILLALCCQRILGAGPHRRLVYTTIAATLAGVVLWGVNLMGGELLFSAPDSGTTAPWIYAVFGCIEMVMGFVQWLAASLLLWRLRGHLGRGPGVG